ncbi:MAG: FeoB-associated Cys-rich membrane protein [Tannerellaceae bacterium]|nr:FeoB-associated Cys-rich membrane protein [Tannerellaceae bacterium]
MDYGWQLVVVVIIGIATTVYVGYQVYRLIVMIRRDNNPCGGCSGCALKDQIDNRKDCSGI